MTFYPKWICRECGEKYGKVKPGLSTYHEADPDNPTDRCGWCGAKVNLTEPRDYGYPTKTFKS